MLKSFLSYLWDLFFGLIHIFLFLGRVDPDWFCMLIWSQEPQ